jgi:hypothetical protein
MRRVVTYGWGALGAGRSDQLGKVLPNALLVTRTMELVGETADLAAQLYQVAGSALRLAAGRLGLTPVALATASADNTARIWDL